MKRIKEMRERSAQRKEEGNDTKAKKGITGKEELRWKR